MAILIVNSSKSHFTKTFIFPDNREILSHRGFVEVHHFSDLRNERNTCETFIRDCLPLDEIYLHLFRFFGVLEVLVATVASKELVGVVTVAVLLTTVTPLLSVCNLIRMVCSC